MIRPIPVAAAIMVALLLQACAPATPIVDVHPLPSNFAAVWSSKNGMPFNSGARWGPGSQCFALRGPLCAGEVFGSRWHQSSIRVENVTYFTLADAEAAWEAQRPSVRPKIMQVNQELEWSMPWVSVDSEQGEIRGFDCRDLECRSWVWVARKDRSLRGLHIQVICDGYPCEERIPILGFRNMVEPLRF